MIIPIDDQHRIAADERQWILQRYAGIGKDGKPRWNPESYHLRLGTLVQDLVESRLRTSDAATLAEALENFKHICNSLSLALTPVIDVKPGFTEKRPKHRNENSLKDPLEVIGMDTT